MITIAWDVDDVLNNLTECWLNYYNKKYNTKFYFNELVNNPPHDILGISYDKYIKSLDEFRMSDLALKLSLNQEILNFMEKHKKSFYHIALTSASAHTVHNSSCWVFNHFNKYIYSYNIVPAKRKYETYHKYSTKKEFLQNHPDIKFLIDDNIKNIEDAKSIGIKAYLLKKPWNNGIEIKEVLNKIEQEVQNESF